MTSQFHSPETAPPVLALAGSEEARARSAAQLATYMRYQIAKPLPQPPSHDGWLLGTVAWSVGGILSAMLIAYAWIDLRPRIKTEPLVTSVAGQWLAAPREWLGPEPERALETDGVLRLRFNWPDYTPAQVGSPDTIHVTVVAADPNHDPAMQLSLWSRFLSSTAWSNPGGLVMREFRKNTPFEQDELYMSVPDGRNFAALCPIDGPGPEEPCRVQLRHGPFDLSVRMPRNALAQWDSMIPALKSRIDAMKR